jgi:sulfur carrier protein ThiS
MISVRVSEAGGVFATVELNEDSTVKDALEKANARLDVAKTITVNSQPAELEDIVEHGDTIYVVPNIKGNK